MSYSVVEYYGENSKYQCGYCKQSSSCSSYGMWAHKLSCQDYQELIDRGWRRSGCYCYKPMMDVTCCPSYTIKCDAINFRLNKSHKKIIKRMNKFLRDGLKETSEQDAQSNIDEIATHDGSACDQEHTEVPSMQPRVLDPDLLNTLTHVNSEKRSADDKTSALPIPTLSGVVNTSTHTSDSSISNQPKKAKLRRIERKREKLQKKGLSGADIEQLMQSNNRKSAEKSLEEFLSESPQDNDSPAHRLKPFQGFGTFHQQYWLDDRLIAVGVIDVLPNCVSSVYFFYDPEYKFLSLGTYGSLRELAYTRSLYKEYPSISNYYMGFYIHSCPKMRYKSNLQPSYLLCPEAYTWHLLDRTVVAKLDASKYSRLNDDPTAQDTNKATEQDVNDVLLIFGRSCMTYTQYLTVVGKELPILFEYARLVGKSCAKKMMLYRV
ncbi:arginyl-tRNA--protein transferase 1 isoform X4 [Anopheles arabiensis]|uniref:arginyl-tRNA--protein transferase 1 isoform X4 n=1 Tax=Anopheles arabiensis TaxID=7173 RepID=UPI001AAD29BA|nr:arginyl-tRNA--protein transferase 1 isoform X4 [Anopheles arabiensis]